MGERRERGGKIIHCHGGVGFVSAGPEQRAPAAVSSYRGMPGVAGHKDSPPHFSPLYPYFPTCTMYGPRQFDSSEKRLILVLPIENMHIRKR